MKNILDVRLDDITAPPGLLEVFGNELIVEEINGAQSYRINREALPVRFDAYIVMLTYRGEMTIGIDYLTYVLKKNTVLEMFSHHILESVEMSEDFKGYKIMVSQDLFTALSYYTDLPPLNLNDQNRFNPVRKINEVQMHILLGILEKIRQYIDDKNHRYRKDIIHTQLATFLLEFGNIKWQNDSLANKPYDHTHKEEIVSQFMQLLVVNCKKESEVSFYSTELCITPEYLSRIMKNFSGKPVNVWI